MGARGRRKGDRISLAPSPRTLVFPVAGPVTAEGWDNDAHRVTYNPTQQLVWEPLAFPRVGPDADGVWAPRPGDPEPRLATSWEGSRDARRWRLSIRPGVRSASGNELTSEDVRWGLARSLELRALGRWRLRRIGGLPGPEAISAAGRYTVDFELARPNPQFASYLVFPSNLVVDAAEARRHASDADPWAVRWLERQPAGFGAFVLAEQADGVIELRAHPGYWAGRPGLDAVVQVGVESRERALALFERGDANAVFGLYPEELARLSGRPGVELRRVRYNHSTLEFDFRRPPFDDRRLRQAVRLALPYDRILRDVYGGYGRRSYGPVSSATLHHASALGRYETDENEARRLVAESAYPQGVETELYIDPTPESLRFAEVARPALAAVGVNAEVRLLRPPPDTASAPMWFKNECSHAVNEAGYELGHDYDSPAGLRDPLWFRDRRWTERLKEVRGAPAGEQPRAYLEVQRELLDFAPCVHVAEVETGIAFDERLSPWGRGEECLGTRAAVWSGTRGVLGA